METFLGDTEESTEDSSGRKRSKLKSLKLRLFGKSKKEGETNRKLSQSASDITAAEALGSDEDLVCNPGAMSSRAWSHDSIFLADQVLTEAEPTRVLSQENISINIKALQEKLQQQKFHLGPPPTILLSKPSEDQSCLSDIKHVCRQSVMTERHIAQENPIKALSQMSTNPILPTPKPVPTKPPPKAMSPTEAAPLDFSSPAQFTSCLDTSAARHRLSVKPRNQRASSKKKPSTVASTALTSDLNNSEILNEEKEPPDVQKEPESETVNAKITETTSVLSETAMPETSSNSSSMVLPQKDISILGEMPTMSTQILRPKGQRPADVRPRPHSFFIPSEAKGKCDNSGNVDVQFFQETQNKTWAANMKSQIMPAEQASVRPGIALQPKVEIDRTLAIKRPLSGSGSFHLSASKRKEDEERPRSGSFTGLRENTWIKAGEKRLDTSPSISPKVDFKPGNLVMGREETWMIKDSLRKVESVRQTQNKVTDAGDHSDSAKEAEEEEAKTTFGVKLRSTSLSMRLRLETASDECLMPEEKNHKQDTSNNTEPPSTKALTAETKTNVSTASCAAKHTAPAPVNSPLVFAEAQPSQVKGLPQGPQGPQPHATSTEVSWMSMAMEKTRSIQNIFTCKFPKVQGRPVCSHKMQVEKTNPAQILDAKSINHPLTNAAKTEAPTVVLPTVQQNTSVCPFREAQTTKPAVSQPTPADPVTHSVPQSNIWTSQSPLRSVRQVESTSQSGTGLSSPHSTPLWSARSLRSTGLAVTQDTTADSETSTADLEEMEGHSVWGTSMSKKVAFLEKKAEWISATVEMKSETLVSKEAKEEFTHTVSNPKKMPERPKEEIRKTADPSSFPSPSPTQPSALQSMSDCGELSWIELAKRKSMAWSDKTMD
ncbi:uncharacterized protein cracdla [Eucyclogobius newberryi]|uniref:uncharacterized protein cracdla n=1 Tax=Eucyclogobius newberryi TaxID=166745 RepID=UPI003B5B6540